MQADEAARRYREQSKAESSGQQATPKFEAKDLESLTGSYHTVCCIDVLIHYPPVSLDLPQDECIDVLPLCCPVGPWMCMGKQGFGPR